MAKVDKVVKKELTRQVSDYSDRKASEMLKDLKKVYETATERTNSAFLAAIDSQNGNLSFSERNLRAADQVMANFTKNLEAAGYNDVVEKFSSKMMQDDLFDFYEDVRPSHASKLLYTTSKSTAQAFAHIRFQYDGLSEAYQKKKRTQVYAVAMGGGSKETAIAAIRRAFEGSAFAKNAETYLTTGIHDFVQEIENLSAKESEEEVFWEYVGPDDDKTRPECEEGLTQRFFTEDERSAFEDATGDARAYNCRHFFVQIPKEVYDEGTGNAK